jgi:hypothetical protein
MAGSLARFERTVRRPSAKLAISGIAIAVVVFVVIGIAAELAFLPKASQPGSAQTTSGSGCQATTVSAGSAPSSPVKTAVDQFIQDFNSRNVAALSNFYAQDACVTWSGKATGLLGTYLGQGNVRILYGSSIGKTDVLKANTSNYNEKASSPSNVNVTTTINMVGHSSVVGNLSSMVDVSQQWTYNGQQWQITKENWNYKTFDVQFVLSSTTFPQWGILKAGQNPNLVSEKSFEWNAGPFVAASVYAFLAGILVMGVVKYRGRHRRASPSAS